MIATIPDHLPQFAIVPNMFGNIFSDHLPQFAVVPDMFGNILGSKSNIHERNWSKFGPENFILGYFSVDCEDLLKVDELKLFFC